MASSDAIRLPRYLVATNGRDHLAPPPGLDAGILLRSTDLAVLIECALATPGAVAVDLDGVRGLGADEAAVDFVRRRLSVGIAMTRKPALATAFAERGGLALVNVLAFDSTGLRRSLNGHPRTGGIGTVISPGIVLEHMLPSEVSMLVRPLVAYGLISTPLEAARTLELADAIVVNPAVAAAIAGVAGGVLSAPRSGPGGGSSRRLSQPSQNRRESP